VEKMLVTIKVPAMFKKLFNNMDEVQARGETIGQIMSDLEEKFPGVEERMNTVIILLDGRDVKSLQGLETPVNSGNEIRIIPLLAGG
jgi:molybdopterin synthase sulfur carrier subunit